MVRASKWILLLWCIFQVFAPILFLKEAASIIVDQSLLNHLFVGMIVFYPLMTIPIVSVLVFTGGVNEERKQGIIMVLLANGVSQTQIWRSKLANAFIVAELVSLMAEGVTLLSLRVINSFWLVFRAKELFFLLAFVPFVAVVISGILCFILWGFQHGQLFATMVPYLLFFGCCFMSLFKYDIINELSGLACAVIIAVGIILLVILDRLIGLFHNEYIVNLGRM